MGQKVVQLDLFRTEKEMFEESMLKSMKALFAGNGAIRKENKVLYERMRELEEVVLRMNDRLNRVVEDTK
jgi:hypothetical protein